MAGSGLPSLVLGLSVFRPAFIDAGFDGRRHRKKRGRDASLAALAGVFCLAASYSFGAGLVGWPVIITHAVVKRWRLAPLMIFGAFAAFTIGSYAYWYVAIANFEGERFHTSLGSALGHPVRLAMFVLNVLAWPPSLMFEGLFPQRFSRWLMLAVSLGACALAVARVALIYLPRLGYVARGHVRPVSFYAAMLVVAALGKTVLAGLSRSGAISGFARSSYGVDASIFWCALVALLLLELRGGPAKRCLVAFAIVTVLMAYAPSRLYEREITERDQQMYQGGVLATLGLDFPTPPSLSGQDPELFAMWRAPRSGGPYAEREPFKWIGHSIIELPSALAPGHCVGQVDSIRTLEGEVPNPNRWRLGRSRWGRGLALGLAGR